MINDSYRWPFIFSLLFHAVLLALLLFSFHDYLSYTASKELGTSQNNPVIQAVAINQQQVENQKIQIKAQQKKIGLKQSQVLQHQQEPVKAEQLLPQQKQLEAHKTEAQQAPKPIEKSIEKPLDHPIEEPTKAVTSLLEKKTAKPVVEKKLMVDPKLKQSMERELQKQLAQESAEQELASKAANEAKEEASQASAAHVQGEIDKYKALIVQAIAEHWLIPDDVRQDLSCELLIRVAADGDVLSVEIARSSGDAVLDRSARAAVFKAAPLPVPKEAEVFDKFRELRLTVRPENLL